MAQKFSLEQAIVSGGAPFLASLSMASYMYFNATFGFPTLSQTQLHQFKHHDYTPRNPFYLLLVVTAQIVHGKCMQLVPILGLHGHVDPPFGLIQDLFTQLELSLAVIKLE